LTVAWRIVKKSRVGEAFSGEGARRYGGRWNHRGTAVVYASGSLSLAALELFVHIGPAYKGLDFASFKVDIPSRVTIDTLSETSLPKSWRQEPPPDSCKDLGTEWVKLGTAAVLRVPSVIVPKNHNYVLNVHHRDFKKLKITQQDNFAFDPRMWK
jgi:RES domain-containing protein